MSNLIKVLDITDPKEFQEECEKYLNDGYILSSSSCGFVNSEAYDFCSSYQAVLVKKECVQSCGTLFAITSNEAPITINNTAE